MLGDLIKSTNLKNKAYVTAFQDRKFIRTV